MSFALACSVDAEWDGLCAGSITDAAGNILYTDPTNPQVFTIISENNQYSGIITYPSRESYFLQGCLSCKWQCLTKLDRRASANASCAVVFSESLALANSFGIVNPFGTSLTFSVVKVWRIHLLFSDVGPCKAGIVWLRADTLPLDTDACLAHVGR